MQLKLLEALSSDCPPDKKAIPGTSFGTLFYKDFIVSSEISSALD